MSIMLCSGPSRLPGGVTFGVLALLRFMFVQRFALETKGRQLEEIQRKNSELAEIL